MSQIIEVENCLSYCKDMTTLGNARLKRAGVRLDEMLDEMSEVKE